MFEVMCEGHGGRTIVSSRSVVSVDHHDDVITLHLRCWCGHLITHETGRGSPAHPSAPDVPKPVSVVAAVPPARSNRAAAHFSGRLGFETDPSDVWSDIRSGAARFVLVDARSREAYDDAHLPGAVSIPHAELEARAAGALLAEHDADLFVTYCWRMSCNAATKGAARLASFGLPVKEMIGGIEGWRAEGLPIVERESEPASATSEEVVADEELLASACSPQLS